MYKLIIIISLFICSVNSFSQENIYLFDDFSSNKFKWDLGVNRDFFTKIENGNLVIDNKTNSFTTVRFVKSLFMYNDSNFVIETKLKFQEFGNKQSGGLIWNSKDENNGFYFELSKNGKVRVWANKFGGFFNLFDWKYFPELQNKEWFTLKIDRKGAYMDLSINDILIYHSGYRGQFANQIGFFVGKNTGIYIDYLLVKHPKIDISDKKIAKKIQRDDLYWLINVPKTKKIIQNVSKNETNEIFERNLSEIKVGETIKLERVLFERASDKLLRDSYIELDKLVKFMKMYPKVEIELSGHTDNRGNAQLNLKLSEKRVEKVKNYLVKQGISAKRISGKGFGGTKPIADNENEITRKLNRRVEFKITKK